MYRHTANTISYFPRKFTCATNCSPILRIKKFGGSFIKPSSPKLTSVFKRKLHSSFSLNEVVSKNSKGKRLSPTTAINISESAVKQLNKIQSQTKNPNEVLRVILESGGCHGFKILFGLSDKLDEDDILFEKDGARVVINQAFLPLLAGATVEYTQELIGSTFKIVDNPNAASGCGCGISFELK